MKAVWEGEIYSNWITVAMKEEEEQHEALSLFPFLSRQRGLS